MRHIRKFENFNKLESSKKFLITMSSANSGGIKDDLTLKYPIVAENWSLGFAEKYDITEFIKKIGNESNDSKSTKYVYDAYAKIIAGLTDILKFGRSNIHEIDHLTDDEINDLVEDLDMIYDKSAEILELESIDDKFNDLNVDKKLEFYKYLLEIGFIIERSSYLYKVIDEYEMVDLYDKILTKLDTLSK
jgi:hypothetical protein